MKVDKDKNHIYDENHIYDDFHIKTEDQKEPRWKKFFIVTGGLFLVFLMISYVFVSFPIGNIIRGQVESEPLIGNVIKLGNFSLFFEGNTKKILQSSYFDEQETEFSYCLLGNVINGNYHITSLYQPKMFEQTFNHVSFEPCSKDTLILLHTHPYKSCVASQTDMSTLEKMKELNEDVLMVVMCEAERFSVYG